MSIHDFDEELLALRMASAALFASRQAMLPREERLVPNLYVLYLHPSIHRLYYQWQKSRNFSKTVAEVLENEYEDLSDEASSSLIDNSPYQVVVYPKPESKSKWLIHPDQFAPGINGKITAYASHICVHNWQQVSTTEDEICSKVLCSYLTGDFNEIIQLWSSSYLLAPLHCDLHFLYAIALSEKGGKIPSQAAYPPFNTTAGVLSFIAMQPGAHVALRSLLDGYGSPEIPWQKNIEKALKMLSPYTRPSIRKASKRWLRTSRTCNYWQEVLELLLDLPQICLLEAEVILKRLEIIDYRYGMEHSALLRLPALLFLYLWTLSQLTDASLKRRRCFWRIEFEAKRHSGRVFMDNESMRYQWNDFTYLLPLNKQINLEELAANLFIDQKSFYSLLVNES